ncbi:MAG TPA: metal-dependent hydrolase [Bryobacteraceae bacterium]|nr:metal-dependent hydrolase [Bryobacteraceae bacterium]
MDNLTHSLTGVLLTRAGLNRLSPRATWLAVFAANVPDLDIVSLLGGVDVYFIHHRWVTHALVFAPLMAAVPVLAVAAIFRQVLPWLRAWLISLVVVASHLLLDFTNPYGIRLFLPFSDAWPALDFTHVIDVWIWAILLIGCLWPILSSLVGSEIGAKRSPGTGIAIAALCLLVLYDTGRYFLHKRAIETLESRVYDGVAPKQTVAFPNNVNPMRWIGWVETERSWQKVNVDLSEEFDPHPLSTFWKQEPSPAIGAARTVPVFQVLEKFARTPLWRVSPAEEPDGATTVELIDLRFGREGRLGFTATAVVDASGRVLSSSFHH